MIYILVSLLCSTASFAESPASSPIREGLGFQSVTAPQFDDAQLLSSIQTAVEESKVSAVTRIQVDAGGSKVGIVVVGDKDQVRPFVFRIENGKPVGQPGTMTDFVTHKVEIPFGTLKMYGFEQKPGYDYAGTAGWLAVGVVGLYAAKKVLNKVTIGRYSVGDAHGEDSMFPTDPEMREEMLTNRELFAHAVVKAEEVIDGQLHNIVKPLAIAAACGHDHGIGLKKPTPSKFVCEGIDEPQAQAARQTLLKVVPNFAVRLGKDFYNELISPIVELVKAVSDKDKRRQTWNFFDLISRRMLKERGVPMAIATGVFVGVGQVVIETLESVALPAGMHMFCQVGNAFVLAVAAKAYTTYFCMLQNEEFKGKTIADRWRTAQQIARMAKVTAEPGSEPDKINHALNLLFRMVERDLRHSRNLKDIEKEPSRDLAWKLGSLRKELTILQIRIVQKTVKDADILSWLKRMYEVQSIIQDCSADLESAA